jgi:hypothetical protein
MLHTRSEQITQSKRHRTQQRQRKQNSTSQNCSQKPAHCRSCLKLCSGHHAKSGSGPGLSLRNRLLKMRLPPMQLALIAQPERSSSEGAMLRQACKASVHTLSSPHDPIPRTLTFQATSTLLAAPPQMPAQVAAHALQHTLRHTTRTLTDKQAVTPDTGGVACVPEGTEKTSVSGGLVK